MEPVLVRFPHHHHPQPYYHPPHAAHPHNQPIRMRPMPPAMPQPQMRRGQEMQQQHVPSVKHHMTVPRTAPMPETRGVQNFQHPQQHYMQQHHQQQHFDYQQQLQQQQQQQYQQQQFALQQQLFHQQQQQQQHHQQQQQQQHHQNHQYHHQNNQNNPPQQEQQAAQAAAAEQGPQHYNNLVSQQQQQPQHLVPLSAVSDTHLCQSCVVRALEKQGTPVDRNALPREIQTKMPDLANLFDLCPQIEGGMTTTPQTLEKLIHLQSLVECVHQGVSKRRFHFGCNI